MKLPLLKRIYNYFHPTLEDALKQVAITEDLAHSKEELERLKEMLEEFEKKMDCSKE